MLPTRDPPQNKRLTQTECEGLEENITSKWTGKKARVAILISDKKDFKTKAIKRDQEGHFTTQGKNPSRRHKHYKYICTQHRSTQIHKENIGGLQERYRQQHTYTRRF